MNPEISSPDLDRETEIALLVHQIYEADCRLQKLAGGQVDEVISPGGASYLLREAQERLREGEERFRSTFEQAAVGLAHVSADGLFLRVNDKLCEITGYAREELIGIPYTDLSMPEDIPPTENAREAMLAGRLSFYSAEKRYQRKDGEIVWVSVVSKLNRSLPGESPYFISVFQDITERRKLEQRFLRAQRMESIGTLAGGIAHDLNNVFGPILMALGLMRHRFPDSESLGLIDLIGASAQRGADMVSQVLSFARGVEGRRMEVQIRHIVEGVEKIAGDTFFKSITVRTFFPPDPWTITGDPTQIHQVLLNLCVNARDAMPNGGLLTMTVENAMIDEHYAALSPEATHGPHVLVRVEDTGMGMTPEVQEKIFDPFYTTKDIGKGTGLGLSTSLAIVKSHGGFIRVSSEAGRGTKFEVYLPAGAESSGDESDPIEVELPRGHGEMILVVDDEEAVRRVTRQTLEVFGYRVIVAADGAEAVATFASRQAEIDGLLTDMMMPGIDGPAAIQVIMKMHPTLPIIAASGLATDAQMARASSLGVKYFLPKPYSARTLLRMLYEIFQGRRGN
jgi:PAS domain S-box-containing protein